MKKIVYRVKSLVDQEEIYTESFSNSEKIKITIIINHGMGGDSNTTIPFIKEILQRIPNAQCINYDIRGHGFSPRNFPKSNTIEKVFALDLQSICQHYQVKKPVFIGHSLGGLICQEYVNQALQPTPLSTVLLSSFPQFPLPNLGRKFWTGFLSRKRENNIKPKKRSVDDHFRFYQSFDYSIFRIISDINHTGVGDFLLMYLSICGWKNMHPELLDKQENLYIFGEKDLVIWPTVQKRFCQNFTHIKQYEILSNHNSIFNAPQKVAQIIAEKTEELST